jgi:hypothetical protein
MHVFVQNVHVFVNLAKRQVFKTGSAGTGILFHVLARYFSRAGKYSSNVLDCWYANSTSGASVMSLFGSDSCILMQMIMKSFNHTVDAFWLPTQHRSIFLCHSWYQMTIASYKQVSFTITLILYWQPECSNNRRLYRRLHIHIYGFYFRFVWTVLLGICLISLNSF